MPENGTYEKFCEATVSLLCGLLVQNQGGSLICMRCCLHAIDSTTPMSLWLTNMATGNIDNNFAKKKNGCVPVCEFVEKATNVH